MPGIDNVIACADGFLVSSGNQVLRVAGGGDVEVEAQFATEVMSIATGPDGMLAIGLDGAGVVIRRSGGEEMAIEPADGTMFNCPTALTFDDGGILYLCHGSAFTGARH